MSLKKAAHQAYLHTVHAKTKNRKNNYT